MFQRLLQNFNLEADAPPRRSESGALRAAVLVDLPYGPHAGGHVRCWLRLAQAAQRHADALDLTVYFTGPDSQVIPVADNVRYRTEPSILSTSRFRFLSHVPDHTDLAPWHPRVASALRRFDVIHTTDAYFTYARTAKRVARRFGIPLVNSVHTNTPEYARLYTGQTIQRLFGDGLATRTLCDALRVPELVEARMLRQLYRYHRACSYVLVSRPSQLETVSAIAPQRVGILRRGIEHQVFRPGNRNRGWLAREFGIAPEKTVVLYVGRLNRGKNIVLLVEAIESLLRRGLPVQLFCAGDGDERRAIAERLGPRVSCPGNLDPAKLAAVYASSDLFAFPSEIEEYANVVLEALASGLPVLVSSKSGMGRVLIENVTGLVLPGDDASRWAEAIGALVEGTPVESYLLREYASNIARSPS